MENEARYTWVGSMVLILILLLAGSLVWLLGGADKTEYRSYSIYFHKQSMDGLDAKSAVKLRGVKMGDVTNFTFVPGSKETIRVNIKVSATTPVHVDTTATIKRNLITGIATVELTNKQGASAVLNEILPNEEYPLILEGSSDLDKVANDASNIISKSSKMLDNLNNLLNERNAQNIEKIFANTATLTSELVKQQQALSDTLKSFQSAALEINKTALALNQTTQRLEVQFMDIGQQSKVTLTQVSASFAEIQQQSISVSAALQGFSNSAQYQMKQVASDVHNVTNVVTSTGQRYANPRALLFDSVKPATAPGE